MEKKSAAEREAFRKTLADMLNGLLPVESIVEIVRRPKDPDRFETILEIEQERVSWSEPILAVLQEHLYIVRKEDGSRVVKCSCGNEFGDWRRNWKFQALVYERDPADGEVFRGPKGGDPDWGGAQGILLSGVRDAARCRGGAAGISVSVQGVAGHRRL